eukprot:gene17315-757_t
MFKIILCASVPDTNVEMEHIARMLVRLTFGRSSDSGPSP